MGKASGERRSKQEAGSRVCLTSRMLDYRLQPLVSAFFPHRGIDLSGPQCQVSGKRCSANSGHVPGYPDATYRGCFSP
jgi:hypothetical protein